MPIVELDYFSNKNIYNPYGTKMSYVKCDGCEKDMFIAPSKAKKRKNFFCVKCDYKKRSHKEIKYIQLATEKNFIYLGPLPAKTSNKTWWQCKNGHRWKVSYASICYFNIGCHYCSKRKQKDIGDYIDLASKKSYIFINDIVPKNSLTKIYWICPQGHLLYKSFKEVSIRNCVQCRIEINQNKFLNSNNRCREWTQQVLNRYFLFPRCIKCSNKRNLEVHHIFNLKDNPTEARNLDNGACFCYNCHKDFHRIFSRRNNTMDQLIKFLGVTWSELIV